MDTDTRIPGGCRSQARPGGRLGSLCARDGSLQITVAAGALPPVLLEANALLRRGHGDQARALLEGPGMDLVHEEVEQDPGRTDVMYVAARLLADVGRSDLAEPWLRRLLSVEPHPQAYSDLGSLCYESRRFHEATECFGRALSLDPDNVSTMTAYGSSLVAMGRTDEGLALLKQAADQYPDHSQTTAMWLWNLHYVPGYDRAFFADQYRQWGRRHVRTHEPYVSRNSPDPDRRIRVGFLSPDFRQGSVASGFEAFLDGYDRGEIEAIGYGRVRCPDRTTYRLAEKFHRFELVSGMPPKAIADRIAGDQVDILVEMGGHVRDNALEVMVLKPAPVQVDYGGIDTSGIEQIDYRLTDPILDPPDTLQYYVEKSLYLPGGLASFVPPRESPLVTSSPAKRNGFVTFGSFNNNLKLNARVMSLWAQILAAHPDSRLVVKCLAGADPVAREHYLQQLEGLGVDRDRVEIHGMLPYDGYLQLIGRVDLCLDSFPFNGCISTLEGLWMGVPTVSLVGDLYVSRVGLSVLSRVGLEVFVASTPEEYVAKACAFAQQTDALDQIRRSLRDRLLASPLCDPGRLGREVTAAFRQMWRQWCDNQKSGVRRGR